MRQALAELSVSNTNVKNNAPSVNEKMRFQKLKSLQSKTLKNEHDVNDNDELAVSASSSTTATAVTAAAAAAAAPRGNRYSAADHKENVQELYKQLSETQSNEVPSDKDFIDFVKNVNEIDNENQF